MYYAISWHDEDYELVEWDIIPEDQIPHDDRLGEDIPALIEDEDRDLFVELDSGNYSGEGTDERAFYINVAGPYYDMLTAQYYIDSEVMPEDDY